MTPSKTVAGEPVAIPKNEVQFTLRAMARNYANGHCWDKLDGEAVLEAADEIKTLRAALASMQEERDEALTDGRKANADREKFQRECIALETALQDAKAEGERLRKALEQAQALLSELVDRDLSYQGENIVIPIGGHGNAIALVRRARAALAPAGGQDA